MTLWIIKILHHWFGVAFAAFFFVISLSGVWLVLDKHVVTSITNSEFRASISAQTQTEAGNIVGDIFSSYPIDEVSQIEFPIKGRAAYVVTMRSGNTIYLTQKSLTAFQPNSSGPVARFMRRVHTNLLNPWGIGHDIVIWTGIVAIFLSVLGLLIVIPQRRSFRKNRILGPREMTFKDMRRAHLSSGLVFSVFIIFFSATGWAIGEPEEVRQILASETVSEKLSTTPIPTSIPIQNISQMIVAGMSEFPDERLTLVSITEQDQDKIIELRLGDKNDFSAQGHSQMSFELETGAVLAMSRGAELHATSRALINMYALHTGEGKGLFYKILIALLGIAVAIVSIAGLLSYILKWRIKIVKLMAKRGKSKN